ncbi:Transcription activator of gluconeogenesis ERT1-2 [Pseudocercospora fuligena]|uniref:Transcription activator of gluconeogenesis ERT1-2 n=1 Tax=Pseudocercospora fuligena TaxID=685502 RepID=A0A8H6RNZ4_9PEZI|nr:Transcription activator of gluconeogenesis ERT1-2 [Pseudocercospora fuligena]
MCTESASATTKRQSPAHDHSLLYPGSLKRKVSPLLRPIRYGEVSYPSPPMSNPPSPPRLPQDQSATFASVSQPLTSSSITATSTLMPAVAIATSSLGPPFYEPAAQAPGHARSAPSFTTPTSATAITTSSQSQPTSSAPTAWQPSAENESITRPTSSRGGRKSKAHVASACINCKRAHLSCDVNRPCARCVASGKQDTCFDVQHKKRGRPRLREEGEFKVEQMLPEPRPTTAIPSGSSDPSVRPLAATRARRAESFRSLRSQGSDSSGAVASPTYPLPPPPTATRPTFDFHYPPIAPSLQPGYEVPTVFLDLDLVIIKANMPYRHIMVGGQEIAGRQLSDIAMPMDGESFQAIRARLRAEREAREPVYMPPIVQPGQDPLNGASEADVERYTQGFDDRTYSWTQTQMGNAAVTFPARVRLAKANAFFVAVTLPTFRPVEPPAPPPLYARMPAVIPLQGQSSDSYTTSRPFATHSAPASAYTPFPAASPLMAPLRSIGHQANRSYPPPQPPLPYQQQTQPQSLQQPTQPHTSYQPPPSGTPRLPVAEPPTETTAFTPRTAARELPGASSTHGAVQLPPIMGSSAHPPSTRTETPPAGPPRTANVPRSEATVHSERSLDEDEGENTPRKRQRMGIDDVLHR